MVHVKLGKKEYKEDPKTAKLANYISPSIVVPSTYDFDKGRAAFPTSMWGNDEWGDCVVAGRANHLLRLERSEQRRTVPITDDLVIKEYKRLSKEENGVEPKEPGDEGDQGLVVLDALKSWRNEGWRLPTSRIGNRVDVYTIAAYGELGVENPLQLRQGIFLFHGIQLGFWLPAAIKGASTWTYKGQTGPQWKPGSWGGHLVYSKAYAPDAIEVISWGMKIKVDTAFLERYCDEAWAVVDSLDWWRKRPEFDVVALEKYLHDIGARVNPV